MVVVDGCAVDEADSVVVVDACAVDSIMDGWLTLDGGCAPGVDGCTGAMIDWVGSAVTTPVTVSSSAEFQNAKHLTLNSN